MLPPKKKGLDVMIAVGKGPKPDLGSPSPLDGPPKKKAPTPEHEAAETPEYEEQEESGASLIQDIEAAGEKHGLDPVTSHAAAADFLRAIANCLSRDNDEGGESEPNEAQSDEENPDGIY